LVGQQGGVEVLSELELPMPEPGPSDLRGAPVDVNDQNRREAMQLQSILSESDSSLLATDKPRRDREKLKFF
jgi:hypothetical protein